MIRLTVCIAIVILSAAYAIAQRMDAAIRRDFDACNGQSALPDTAISACWRAINSGQLSQDDVAISHNNVGYELARKGEFAQAISQFDRAIEIMPDYAYAFMNRSLVHYRMGGLDLAMVDVEKAMSISTELGAYAARARILVSMGMPNEAMPDANRVIREAPRVADGYLARGDALRALGKEKEALNDYRNAQRREMDEYIKMEVEKAIAALTAKP